MRTRTWILITLVLATAGYTRFLSDVQAVPLRKPLEEVPLRIGEWTGRSDRMAEDIVRVVGVEDYLLREYRDGEGFPVYVYVGFYERQREGDQIHSPKHCLPGAGWRPVVSDRVVLDTPGINGGATRANRYVIGKGDDRQLVLYWYQSRGRDITSEYLAKLYLVVDSIFRKRNDGSLVRLMAPLSKGAPIAPAQERVAAFARRFLPELARALPEG
ncbi:MAG: hypothetical protein Kow0092_26520 [Deferrisomatales bacterium]